MHRLTISLTALALGTAATLALSSCGGSDAQLLPGETAREITANLDKVQQLANEGDCIGAESAVQQVGEQIEALGGVDPKLKQALRDGATRLSEVIDECEEAPTEAISPASVPETTESTTPEPPGQEKKEKEKGAKKKQPEEEVTPPTTPPVTSPPEASGEEEGSESEDGGTPSGGVSPGESVGEGE
jgi:hypothetical protein